MREFFTTLCHTGRFMFDHAGNITGFRSNVTGALYDPSDVDLASIEAAMSEKRGDVLFDGYMEDVEIEHFVQIDNTGKMIVDDSENHNIGEYQAWELNQQSFL